MLLVTVVDAKNTKINETLQDLKDLNSEHFIILFIFGCAGSSLLCGLFSGCGKQGLLSSYGAQTSVIAGSGLSSRGSWTLEHRFSSCGARLRSFVACRIFFPDQGSNPCLLH